MRVALGIMFAAVVAVGSAGAAVWQQADRQLRTLRSSNAELRSYAAELGERVLELERGLDAVVLQGSPVPAGGSVEWSRLDSYIRATADYAACRQADDLKTMLRPDIGRVGGCRAPPFRLSSWMSTGSMRP